MTLDFINKRIKEQAEYLARLRILLLKNIITQEMYDIVHETALTQFQYFIKKKKNYVFDLENNPN